MLDRSAVRLPKAWRTWPKQERMTGSPRKKTTLASCWDGDLEVPPGGDRAESRPNSALDVPEYLSPQETFAGQGFLLLLSPWPGDRLFHWIQWLKSFKSNPKCYHLLQGAFLSLSGQKSLLLMSLVIGHFLAPLWLQMSLPGLHNSLLRAEASFHLYPGT